MAHALIFGVSGISGWALAIQALEYPSKNAFERVTGLSNRPLSREDAHLPNDPRLQLASGVDLTGSLDSIVNGLRSKVPSIETVSHVFFTAYSEQKDHIKQNEVNTKLLVNAVQAVEETSKALKSVVLQTGGKWYGVEFTAQGKFSLKAPLKEDVPRISKPWYDHIFYYPQYDALMELSKGKQWRFVEVRPDGIVGFSPAVNFMNVALGLAFYITLFREIHGEGATIPFPGGKGSWKALATQSSQDILARQEIHHALNQDKIPNGTSFNSSDGDIASWEMLWASLTSHFGLKGTEPEDQPVNLAAFAKDNEDAWKVVEAKYGLKTGQLQQYGWDFLNFAVVRLDFDRYFDLEKVRAAGFEETVSTSDSFITTFKRLRAGKLIP